MSQIETVIRASKQLEQLLEKHHGASGRGLHEKTSSIETQLAPDMTRRLRKIATLRNKVVHEDFDIEDLAEFQASAAQLAVQLQPKTAIKQPSKMAKTSTAPVTSKRPIATPPTQAPAQPRVRLPPKKTKSSKPSAQHTPTAPRMDSEPLIGMLPAFSGLLIFITIVWILGH